MDPVGSRGDPPALLTIGPVLLHGEGQGWEHVSHVVGTCRHDQFCASLEGEPYKTYIIHDQLCASLEGEPYKTYIIYDQLCAILVGTIQNVYHI